MKKHNRFDWAIKRLLLQRANFVVLEGFLSELLKQDVLIKEIFESERNKTTKSTSTQNAFNKMYTNRLSKRAKNLLMLL